MVTGAGRTMAWDYDNRLSSVTASGSTTSMVYDYTGMRTEKIGPLGTTIFPVSGYEIGPGGVSVKYIRIGIENVASKKSTGEKFSYHNDHLGGVNVITNTSGVLAQLIEYDPWGKVSWSEGAGDSLRRFTGKILDPESDLYYYGGRYYDPEIGRFISPDPFVPQFDDPQSHNRYSYVVNNPVNNIDPDGYTHTKKKKKKGGFFRRFFGIFSIIVGIFTLQPELAALGAASEAGISLANIGIGLASIGRGIADLASGTGGLGGIGSPGGLGSPDFGLDLGVGEFLGAFFSPALRLAAEAGCDSCSDSRLDLLRALLGLFQAAEAHAGENDTGRSSGSAGRAGVALGRPVPYSQYIATRGGNVVRIPPGWQGTVVETGQGLCFQRPGAVGNAESIRIMDPTPRYPQGYVVYYNRSGQPLDMFGYAGNRAGRAATHIPLNQQPLPGLEKSYREMAR